VKANFADRFAELVKILRNGKLIPEIQIRELELNPVFNPELTIEPTGWWKYSFEWYVAIPLIDQGEYGPFYRVDGDHFWPHIGVPGDESSEKKCFFGLEKPKDQEDAKTKYNLRQDTPRDFVYTIKRFKPVHFQEMIFIGPVRGGSGYQMNPNARVVDRIRSALIRKDEGYNKEDLPERNKSDD